MTPNSQSPPGLAAHPNQSPDVAVDGRSHEIQSSAEAARSEGLVQFQPGIGGEGGSCGNGGSCGGGGGEGGKCSCGGSGRGCSVGGYGGHGIGNGGGVVAAAVPNNLAVTFSVGKTQEQQHQQQQQQHQQQGRQQEYADGDSRPAVVVVERVASPPAATATVIHIRQQRPRSIESLGDIENVGGSGTRETSSYVWRVLVYLAFINPFLCLVCSLYALLVLLAVLITYPIRSFFLPKTLATHPPTPYLPQLLLVHMRLIYPQPTSTLPSPDDFDPVRLVLVHLFGPFLAGVVAAAGWVLVFVWIYTEVLLGEKNDGRGAEYRAVMFVKRKWEEWILVALKPKSLDGY
ncbi:uncharacterized protein H6S33_000311 [Morchella sextelata]|uniref:uncharacterized protein n=1 Tax=Morchella sextelata TaxID=1174677 RepID=UPI001D041BF0|nr:uncharacterized protein H6S33_000311 [Morchella sextelata]KAH0614675.1 hypothetical protein H6S33_000311 [Morchella sextelata]